MTPKCSICGKFAKIVDVGVPFGTYGDVEPPDEIQFCATCAGEAEERAVREGYPPQFWMKPEWSLRAAKRLGFVEIAFGGNAWSGWWPSENPLPEGAKVVERK